ncbi:MAG: NUDIX domain-containing protein [Nanoarchaeota archaeon]
MTRTDQVECIVFRRCKAGLEYLLLKRIPEKGGFWQPPCGGVEPSETIEKAALRELFEETGITKEQIVQQIPDVHQFTMNKHYLTGEEMPVITEHVIGLEVGEDVLVSFERNIHAEHEEYCWVGFEEALRLLKWENNEAAFRKLNRLLSLTFNR